MESLSENCPVYTDRILANREGCYVSVDKENIPYIVKRWYEGRECDTRKNYQLEQ